MLKIQVFRHFGRTDGYAAGGAGGDDGCTGLAGGDPDGGDGAGDGCAAVAELEPYDAEGPEDDCAGLAGGEPEGGDGAVDDSAGLARLELEGTPGATEGTGAADPPGACGATDAELAVHFVQIVEVEVMSTVDTVWVVRTASLVPDVTVVVTGQVVTDVTTLWGLVRLCNKSSVDRTGLHDSGDTLLNRC